MELKILRISDTELLILTIKIQGKITHCAKYKKQHWEYNSSNKQKTEHDWYIKIRNQTESIQNYQFLPKLKTKIYFTHFQYIKKTYC